MTDENEFDQISSYCADLLSEIPDGRFLLELLAAPQGQWIDVADLVGQLGLDTPALGALDGPLVAAWLPAPEVVVLLDYAIIFCLPREIWSTVGFYSPPGRRRRISDPPG